MLVTSSRKNRLKKGDGADQEAICLYEYEFFDNYWAKTRHNYHEMIKSDLYFKKHIKRN